LGLVPLFYHEDIAVAQKIVTACVQGGARVIEFTNRGDFAYQVFTELARYVDATYPEVMLGVGSVIDAPTAALYIASGADFIVSPILNPETARMCNRRKIAYMPGCGSVSEISQAEELGVEIVKLFPGGAVGGPGFVKAVLGPCPWSRIMPTGGVEASRENIESWFKEGNKTITVGECTPVT
jgi:2-dehydro-3-deoxyphosphogluconate aldolase/(4S)-4-hydroxy-2-oxoglutarate aldolase